jgi:GntR family transcriptional repressor for pyruvate dehydrogenase complex
MTTPRRPQKNSTTDADKPADRAATIFNPIRPKRAFDEISNEIKRLIFTGVLKPGDRLPSETELANQFGVGRQTIREALRLLELSGFISMQKGGAGGPLIVDTILSTISSSFVDVFQMGSISHDELTVARMEVEKMVLRHVFANAGPEDIEALRENVVRARRKINQNQEIFDENIGFHRLLAKASKNQVFVIALESILAVVAHFRSLFTMGLQGPRKVLEEHEHILDAIEKGRYDEAFILMEKHLISVDQRFRDLVTKATAREIRGASSGPLRKAE